MSVNIKNKTQKEKNKKIFTRLTLDEVSLKAVKRVQSSIQNYDINDAVRMIFGLGMSQLNSILPEVDENNFDEKAISKLEKSISNLKKGNGTEFQNTKELVRFLDQQ